MVMINQRLPGSVGMTGIQPQPFVGMNASPYQQQQAQGLGQMAAQQTAQAYKGGGSASHVLAHFNKKELKVLEALQGGERKDKKTGLPTIDLSHAFNNHHVMDHVKKHITHHLATGGEVASEGRYGDNALASVEKNTSDALDYCQGGCTINPHTGLKEHFSLSGILNGLKSVGKSVMGGLSSAGKSVMPYVQKYGPQALEMAGSLMANPQQGETPSHPAAPSPLSTMDPAAKQKLYDGYLAQKSGQPAVPKPAAVPQAEGESGLPSWMQGLSKNIGKGGSLSDVFSTFGKGMLNQYGNKLPSWMQGAAQTGMDMMGGKDPKAALSQYGRGMMNQYGGTLPAWMQQGGKSALNVIDGADPQEEAMNYGQGMLNHYGN